MALGLNKRPSPWLSRLHFLARAAGVTGLLVALSAVALAWAEGQLPTWESAWSWLQSPAQSAAGLGPTASAAAWAFAGGAALFLFLLLIEAALALRTTAGRRSAAGLNAAAQVGLAAVLLIGVNAYAFFHHARIDCSRPNPPRGEKAFTLPADLRKDLQRLRGKTTIVLLRQMRQPAEQPAGDEDDRHKRVVRQAYEKAAADVVVQKVRDLADQVRAVGPQRLEIIELDTSWLDYPKRLQRLRRDKPRLVEEITRAPGSSIFFYAEDGGRAHVQRVGFEDFYQLDLKASLADSRPGGKDNLVLLNKGVGPLLRRILNLQERRPRVGLLLTHEAFSTRSDENYPPYLRLARMRKTLEQHGFEVQDILLKRNHDIDRRAGTWTWEPAALTFEESNYDDLARRRDRLPLVIARVRAEMKAYEKERERWEKATPRQVEDQLRQLGLAVDPEPFRRQQVRAWARRIEDVRAVLGELEKERKDVIEKLEAVSPDVLGELQRTTDLRAKLDRLLADCDLLMIVRPMLFPEGQPIIDNAGLHRLEDFQLQAIRDFLKKGKPVLACLGPAIRSRPPFLPGQPPEEPGEDSLEKLLAELNVRLDRTAVVYRVQAADLGEERGQLSARGGRVPPLDFQTPHNLLRTDGLPSARADNPLRESLRRTADAWGGEFDLKLRFPRPVWYDGRGGEDSGFSRRLLGFALAATPPSPLSGLVPLRPRPPGRAAEFLWTRAGAWKDEDPLRSLERQQPADEKARGRFPVGVAVEAELPAGWKGSRPTARVAVIGHGRPFVDADLNPAHERLLLDTCNWLLGRDDLLAAGRRVREADEVPTEEPATWQYPRLSLDERARRRWLLGAGLGPPLLFAYLGVMVLLVRRVR